MSIFESLGLTPIINAAGSVTRLGGAPVPDTVWQAYHEGAAAWVPLEQVQAAASRVIAQLTGSEAGLVTAGAAASLTLGAAAIMTGLDPARMDALPDTRAFPHEFVVARAQRNGYDHAVRAAGARLVEVGLDEVRAGAGGRQAEIWEYEAAISEHTAGMLYFFTSDSQPPLEDVVALAHRHDLPVLVDAAGQLPPRANLLLASVTGADLVAYSGGKAIRAPQSTGILCGTRSLVAAAGLQMLDMDEHPELWEPPSVLFDQETLPALPRHGIGRAMKVTKEEIVALITALALFSKGEYDEEYRDHHRQLLARIRQELDGLPVLCRLRAGQSDDDRVVLEVAVEDQCTHSALDICRRLRQGTPPIYLGHTHLHENKLIVDPLCLDQTSAQQVAERLAHCVRMPSQ